MLRHLSSSGMKIPQKEATEQDCFNDTLPLWKRTNGKDVLLREEAQQWFSVNTSVEENKQGAQFISPAATENEIKG